MFIIPNSVQEEIGFITEYYNDSTKNGLYIWDNETNARSFVGKMVPYFTFNNDGTIKEIRSIWEGKDLDEFDIKSQGEVKDRKDQTETL